MTSITFPSSGGSVVMRYELAPCHTDSGITFTTTDSWYTIVQDTTNEIVTVTASAGTNNSGSISVKIGNKTCDPISVSQISCNCDSFNGTISFNYTIPSGGTASGTVVGSYSLAVGCSESNIVFGGDLQLTAQNGNIKLAQDIDANPSDKSLRIFNVKVYYGTELIPCAIDTLTQEAREFECTCDYILSIVESQNMFFSNIGLESVPTGDYTYLKDVLVASAETFCGEFSAVCNTSMLSTEVKGHTLPENNRVLIEEENGIIKAYVTVLEQNVNADERECWVHLWFKAKGESEYIECSSQAIRLIQSPAGTSRKFYPCKDSQGLSIMFSGGYCSNAMSLTNILYAQFSGAFRPPHDPNLSDYIKYHTYVGIRAIEAGYVLDSFFSSFDVKDKCYDDGTTITSSAITPYMIADSSVNPYDWVSIKRIEEGDETTSYNFIYNGEENRLKYVKIAYDLYTSVIYENGIITDKGVFCKTLGEDYIVTFPSGCSLCYDNYDNDEYHIISFSGETWHFEKPNANAPHILCNHIVTNITVSPSSAATITDVQYDGEEITAFTITIPPNLEDTRKEFSINYDIKFMDGRTCNSKNYRLQGSSPCICENFTTDVRSIILYNTGSTSSCNISYNPLRYQIDLTGETKFAIFDSQARIVNLIDDPTICGYDVYLVPCSDDGVELTGSSQPTWKSCNDDNIIVNVCQESDWHSDFRYSIFGYKLKRYVPNYITITTDHHLNRCPIEFFYKIKVYMGNLLVRNCNENVVHHFSCCLTTEEPPNCDSQVHPSCYNIPQINSQVNITYSETETIGGDTFIIVHPSGLNNVKVGEWVYGQDTNITDSMLTDICDGYKIHLNLVIVGSNHISNATLDTNGDIYVTTIPFIPESESEEGSVTLTPHLIGSDGVFDRACTALNSIKFLFKKS